MKNYEIIYRKKEHHITIPQRQSRKLYFGNEHLNKIIKNQKKDEDVFITKYANDGVVGCLILDFDDDDKTHQNAYNDVKKAYKYTMKKDLNPVIVSSTNKGYHLYIQIPPRYFGNGVDDVGVNRDVWFNKFVEYIINQRKFKYKTLDATNTSAGLRGNIRIVGSIHPKTNERVHILEGTFKDFVEPNEFEWDCLQQAYEFADLDTSLKETEKRNVLRELRNKKHDGQEMIDQNDLRVIMPSVFGGEVKTFKKGYIMMQCPFHSDSKPSMYVDKEKYFCKSCHAKGNWWTLKKMGYVDFPKQEFIRVKTLKKVRI